MSNKINKEELETLQSHVNTQSKALHDIGALENQKFHLLHALNQAQQKSEEFKKSIEEIYGKINIDLKDGSFEPIVEEVEVAA
jgi:hypothetical protein|tara:strand:- start:2398 stop:2646 length:249 start_codon:yes stop_codon:yes gene_type:complete